jgi:hypothetical protein
MEMVPPVKKRAIRGNATMEFLSLECLRGNISINVAKKKPCLTLPAAFATFAAYSSSIHTVMPQRFEHIGSPL